MAVFIMFSPFYIFNSSPLPVYSLVLVKDEAAEFNEPSVMEKYENTFYERSNVSPIMLFFIF